MKRLILAICLISTVPFAAMADTGDLQVKGSGAASSTAASSLLQPSTPESLQATNLSGSDGSSSTGLTAPDSSNLQASSSNDAISNYLSGELVGGPEGASPSSAASTSGKAPWYWLAVGILLALVAVIGTMYARGIRRSTRDDLLSEMPAETQLNDAPLTTDMAEAVLAAEATDEHDATPKTNVKGAGKNANTKHGKSKSKAKSKKKTRKH